MEITLIVLGFIGVFFIGFTIGAVKNTPEIPECCLTCLKGHDSGHYQHLSCYGKCCDHFGCETLRTQIRDLERERMYWIKVAQDEKIARYKEEDFSRRYGDMFLKVGDKERAAGKLKEAMKPLKELEKELS